MNVSAAIATAIGMNVGITDLQIEKSAMDFGLVITDEYVADLHACAVNAAASKLLTGYLLINSLSEGGFSISVNVDGIKSLLSYLAANSCGLFTVPDEFRLLDRRVRARHIW